MEERGVLGRVVSGRSGQERDRGVCLDVRGADALGKRATGVVAWTCVERKCTKRPKMAEAGRRRSEQERNRGGCLDACGAGVHKALQDGRGRAQRQQGSDEDVSAMGCLQSAEL